MEITSLALPNQDDYSYFLNLLQGDLIEMNTHNSNNKKRQRKVAIDGKRATKKKALNEILTSMIVFEDQEKSDQDEWIKTSQQEKVIFEANHKEKTQIMLNCNGYLPDFDSDQLQTKQPCVAASNQLGGKNGAHRRLWVKDRSKAWWDSCNHPDFPEEEFRRAFRMSRATFDMICEELNSVVAKEDTMLRAAIPVPQRVAVCIWRLATGEPLRLVSKRFGLGISTCHKLVLEVCSAIKTVLMPKFLQWPDEDSLKKTKETYESAYGIPNVVGSMYTTHIPIIAPKISVGAYFNKRHTERNQKTSYSITVQGVVDQRGVFTDVCIGWPGSMPDDQVLENSILYKRANGGQLKDVWIVGNSGYPLMDWVMVPYTHQHLTWTQHAFNEKIGEIQSIAKESFARLKGRWRCLQRRTEVKLQDLPVVLGACCVLHNICEMNNEEMDPDLRFELIDDEMVPESSMRSVSTMQARDSIAHNLLHHGLAGTAFL
ncbi:hypothetical protein HHK36_014334 [Tetracentron sinense]|uniref:DDE Tnp4 domain-containing protein n=1 Tax=Tetracentron sinense TaxID=13715 RepID=A0A834ZC29_TETSI|nr:hypothetical protein HHK36_014334 [Tetracentron sinense]